MFGPFCAAMPVRCESPDGDAVLAVVRLAAVAIDYVILRRVPERGPADGEVLIAGFIMANNVDRGGRP